MARNGFALMSAAVLLFAQTALAEVRSTGTHDKHLHPSLHDHHPQAHPRALHDGPDLFGLHNMLSRIDSAQGLSDAERRWLQEKTDNAGRVAAEMHDATHLLETLRAENGGTVTDARKAEIEAQVAAELKRLEAGQTNLKSLEGQLQERIENAPDVSDADKEKLKKLLALAKERAITLHQAEEAVGTMDIPEQFALILVLFILLVIIGAGFG